MIFNLCVSDPWITSIHLQVVPNVQKSGTESRANDLNFSLAKLGSWSKDSNLALNPVKTKYMVLSTQQMSAYHKLADHSLNLGVGEKPLGCQLYKVARCTH